MFSWLTVSSLRSNSIKPRSTVPGSSFFSICDINLPTVVFLNLVSIAKDCDDDTLLIKVNPVGPVCHTGADTCFEETNRTDNFLLHLESVIQDRRDNPSDESYTTSLFKKGINKVAQKVGEEAVELVIEAKDDDKDLFMGEAADLMYHYLVLLAAKNYTLDEVIEVLKNRHK